MVQGTGLCDGPSLRRGRTPMRSAACWRRTFTGPASTSPASSGCGICQQGDEKVPLLDFIEQRLKSDPVAQKILAMDAAATRELDTQALEQILIGHLIAIAGEANQTFRPVSMFDHGIDS